MCVYILHIPLLLDPEEGGVVSLGTSDEVVLTLLVEGLCFGAFSSMFKHSAYQSIKYIKCLYMCNMYVVQNSPS